MFNLVEGLVNHQLLQIHHVRDDLGGPLAWDLGFLAFGALLIVAGLALRRSDRSVEAPAEPGLREGGSPAAPQGSSARSSRSSSRAEVL